MKISKGSSRGSQELLVTLKESEDNIYAVLALDHWRAELLQRLMSQILASEWGIKEDR